MEQTGTVSVFLVLVLTIMMAGLGLSASTHSYEQTTASVMEPAETETEAMAEMETETMAEAETEAPGEAPAEPETEAPADVVYKYADGTYVGKGRGMGGDITVTLTIVNDVITVDEITGPYETPGVGGKEAIEDGTFKAQIEEVQSSEIEGVAGATMSSGGVRKAVKDALTQAKQAKLGE